MAAHSGLTYPAFTTAACFCSPAFGFGATGKPCIVTKHSTCYETKELVSAPVSAAAAAAATSMQRLLGLPAAALLADTYSA
jgi:hypothetical protein